MNSISVIVCVYNVKNYIQRCVDSLINQTRKGIEIILVDDGSTDGSGELCDLLKSRADNIVVVHQDNMGITGARKSGLKAASGEYVGFVDPDDWIEADMYSDLMQIMEDYGVDIVCSGMKREKDKKVYAEWKAADYDEGLYEKKDLDNLIVSLFKNREIHISGSMCNKLFKRRKLEMVIEKVNDNLRGVGDDIVCTVPYIINSKKIFITHVAYYHGCDREDSATHSKHDTWLLQGNITYLTLKECIKNSKYYGLMIDELDRLWEYEVYVGLKNMFPDRYNFRFDIENLPKGKTKIAIYGAGNVGRSYYSQFLSSKYNIVLWVDQNWELISKKDNIPVYEIDRLKKVDFDILIIALMDREEANSIKDMLMKKYRINEKKKLFGKDHIIFMNML